MRKYHFLILALFLFLPAGALAAAPQGPTAVTDSGEQAAVENSQTSNGLTIIGAEEFVLIEPESEKLLVRARIDSGANTSSLWAEKVVEFERDGTPWVRFVLPLDGEEDGKTVEFERKIERTVKIKRKNADNVSRYVVWMLIRVGDFDERLQFTLADRSGFDFPILLGRNFLHGNFLIDVSRTYTIPREFYEQ